MRVRKWHAAVEYFQFFMESYYQNNHNGIVSRHLVGCARLSFLGDVQKVSPTTVLVQEYLR